MLDWQRRVTECTGANIFFIKDGKIHTPIADGFLAGIPRATAIDLARSRGIEVIERRIMPEELDGFTECFITVTAVVGDRELGVQARQDLREVDGGLHRRSPSCAMSRGRTLAASPPSAGKSRRSVCSRGSRPWSTPIRQRPMPAAAVEGRWLVAL